MNLILAFFSLDLVHDKDIVDRQARSSLVRAQTSLIAIVADLREHTERLSLIRKEEALRNQDIHTEANRLKAAFRHIRSGSTKSILAMDPELQDICALLEREVASRERGLVTADLEDFLQELDEQDDNSEVFLEPLGVDVDAELYRAYCLDQIAVLQTYESGLDQVSFLFTIGFTYDLKVAHKYDRLLLLLILCSPR